MKSVVITGGAGYLGSVISDYFLKKGWKVKVIDLLFFDKKVPLRFLNNPNYDFMKTSFSDFVSIEKFIDRQDYVIHCASIVGEPASRKYPDLAFKINYRDTVEFINFLCHKEIKGFIFISTCSNYGISDDIANENSPLNPLSLYAETKVKVEEYLKNEVKDLKWVICRLSTLYGISPRMRFDLTVNEFTARAFFEKYIDVYLPNTYRPYLHVFDAARFIYGIIENFDSMSNEIFNIGFNGENYKKIEIIEIIRKFIPDLKIEIVRKGSDKRNYRVDFSKIQNFLKLKPIFRVEDGVKQIIKAFENKILEDYRDSVYYNTEMLFK